MKYAQPIIPGKFIARPNRFIATVEVDGVTQTVHVKNTGRCKELLLPGATVYLEHWDSPGRKTKYDLIAVEKGDRLINMDSQAPNKVAGEYLKTLFPHCTCLKPEVKYGNSRFDFYLETPEEKWFVEVKGVTLEEDNVAYFPDAPTQRGVKHIHELVGCMQDGYRAMVLFIVQMEEISHFTPNDRTHPAFGAALRAAQAAGVQIHAVDCIVTPDSLMAHTPIPVVL